MCFHRYIKIYVNKDEQNCILKFSCDNKNYASIAQLDRALPSEGKGREFESR